VQNTYVLYTDGYCVQVYRWLCCIKSAVPKAEYSLVCIGLTKAGKTTLLSVLCNENEDDITATTGSLAVMFYS